jgi:hypothetical protein
MASTRPNPFKAFLPDASPAAKDEFEPLPSCRIRNVLSVAPLSTDVDPLDKYLLSCVRQELALNELLDRLPCSRAAAMRRIRRLVENGSLAVRQAPGGPSVPCAAPEIEERDTVRPSPSRSTPAA